MVNDKRIEDKNQSSFYNQNVISRINAIKNLFFLSIAYVLLLLLRTVPVLFSTYPLTDRRYREERFIKGALIAISVGAFFAILAHPLLDKTLYIALLLLAIAIPLLAVSIYAEFLLHSLSADTTAPKAVQYMGLIGGFSTILAIGVLFLHLSYLAGLVFFILCVIGALIFTIAVLIFMFRDGIASLSSELPPGSQERFEMTIKLFNESPIPGFLRDKEKQKMLSQFLILALNIMSKRLYQKQPQSPRGKGDNQNLK